MNFIQKSSIIQETGTATITLAAPGAGRYNCITSVTVESDTAGDLTISNLKGGYTFTAAVSAGGGFTKEWVEPNMLIGTENTAVAIAMSGGGNYNICVRGFVTP